MATQIIEPMAKDSHQANRLLTALDAVHQVDAILDTLGREKEHACFEFLVSATLPRMRDLTSVIMSVLGDDQGRETSEMMEVVHGR